MEHVQKDLSVSTIFQGSVYIFTPESLLKWVEPFDSQLYIRQTLC